jgi:Tfp pilus assembly protein PilF
MGAIHFAQQDYAQAVKQFRMGLDTTLPAYRRLRLNTIRNIGLAAVRSGRYQEATGSFAAIMQVAGGWVAGCCQLLECGELAGGEGTGRG